MLVNYSLKGGLAWNGIWACTSSNAMSGVYGQHLLIHAHAHAFDYLTFALA